MAAFETGRRLCLLFEAGHCRYAIEATSVVEVAAPDASGQNIRGLLDLKDLSQLFGGPSELRPGTGVVLDVSPTLAVRVGRIIEVADVAKEPFFHLPPGLSDSLALLVRGAIFHRGQLFLELFAEALPKGEGLSLRVPPRPVYPATEPPERALVFQSQHKLFGLPLGSVSQVVSDVEAFCPLPTVGGPVAGLFPHGQALWPIYSAAGLLGARADAEPLFILSEVAGLGLGICATKVLGVHQRFATTEEAGLFRTQSLEQGVLFLDLQRMFS